MFLEKSQDDFISKFQKIFSIFVKLIPAELGNIKKQLNFKLAEVGNIKIELDFMSAEVGNNKSSRILCLPKQATTKTNWMLRKKKYYT